MNFLLLQINDSAFPIGSYTQSFGLETYIQKGLITNKKEALHYVQSLLYTQILYTDLLAIKLIFEAKEWQKIFEIESILQAGTPAKEMRLGMQRLGARFIKAVQSLGLGQQEMLQNKGVQNGALKSEMFKKSALQNQAFQQNEDENLQHAMQNNAFQHEVFTEYTQTTTHPTHPSAYALFCKTHTIAYKDSIQSYTYTQAAHAVTNCVKLIPLSQYDGQEILYQLHTDFLQVFERLETLGIESLCNASVQNDICAMGHEYLEGRLYMS